jgi:hypothetical protein
MNYTGSNKSLAALGNVVQIHRLIPKQVVTFCIQELECQLGHGIWQLNQRRSAGPWSDVIAACLQYAGAWLLSCVLHLFCIWSF